MKKICLTVVGLFIMMINAFSQITSDTTDKYTNRKLRLDETNIVSGYYSQTGNHSAITGGIGTQQLTDVSNIIELKFVKLDPKNRKNNLDLELGIDHHTAASSAFVSLSGSSKTGGTRIYPSFNWSIENAEKRTTLGFGASYSTEYTYLSYGLNATFTKKSKDNNREFNFKGQAFFDQVTLVEPDELKPKSDTITTAGGTTVITSASGRQSVITSTGETTIRKAIIPSSPRNTFDIAFTLSQVVNKRLQLAVIAEGTSQSGYLGLPFHRVYFQNGKDTIENLPDTRQKLPLALRANYFAGDKFVIRSYYRFYTDSWGITAHTAEIETAIKFSPFISVSPFYRYYIQTASNYFAPYEKHTAADTYYTSNYELSAFSSQYAGINFRLAPPKGVLGMNHFSILEIRAGHYVQTTGLVANDISLNLRFK